MNRLFWLAVIGAACVPNAASALTYVQTDSEAMLRGFDAFDASKGTLNKVTLGVRISNKSRVWQVNVPSAQRDSTAAIAWTVNGLWELRSNVAAFNGLTLGLTGTGSDLVTFDRLTSSGQRAFAYFDVAASGNATFDLNPTAFTAGPVRFNGFDTGYYGDVGDTTFTNLPMNSQHFQLNRACFVNSSGNPAGTDNEDACGGVGYTLTYDYTAAVPEPATWAMMMAGFAATGAALRRRRRMVAA